MESDVQTIRQPSFTALLVDSMDRYSTGFPADTNQQTTSSQWVLQSAQYVLNGYFTRLSVTQLQFFWNLPTIVTGYNDTINFDSGSVIIPQGWYICDSLASTIQTQFSSLYEGGTCVADPITGVLTFSASVPFSISPASSLLLGRTYQTTGIIPGASTGTGPYTQSGTVPTMLTTRFINIESKYLTKFQRVKDSSTLTAGQSTNILCRIYAFAPATRTPWPPTAQSGLDVDTPFVLSIDYSYPKLVAWDPTESVSNFDLTLTDEYGTLVPWAPAYGCEYQLTITASET
jgi:hypothetical protein